MYSDVGSIEGPTDDPLYKQLLQNNFPVIIALNYYYCQGKARKDGVITLLDFRVTDVLINDAIRQKWATSGTGGHIVERWNRVQS
jgi:hypothetical protein